MRYFLLVCLVAPALGFAAYVGPPSSSAGVIEREIEKEYEAKEISPEKPVPSLEIEIPQEQLEVPDGEKVEIQKIEFTGNEVLSSDDLAPFVAPYTNRELSLKEIREICLMIQRVYVEKGYFLARVYPPPQELQESTLTICIIEGKLGEVFVEGNKHYSSDYIAGYFSRLRGRALNYDDLIAALLLLNENRDLSAGAILKKGSKWGTADLILRIQDKPPFHTYVDVNNYGSDPTTLYRSGLRIDAGNLFTNGDCLSLTGVIGYPPSNLYFTNGTYSVPLNRRGTNLDLSFLYSAFQVSTFQELDLSGSSMIGSAKISQAVIREKELNTDLFLSFDYKQIKNLSHSTINSFDKLRVVGIGAHVDLIDHAKGRNFADPALYVGIPNFLGGSKAIDLEASRIGSGGRFIIFDFDYKRIQQISRYFFALLTFSSQLTPSKLPVAEQIYIGGIDTVRGYPMASGLGDNGYYMTLEFRATPPKVNQWLQLIAFVDHGGVAQNGQVTGEKNGLLLTSTGVGAHLFAPWSQNLGCNLDVAFPLTDKPQSSIPGQPTSFYTLYFRVSWQLDF